MATKDGPKLEFLTHAKKYQKMVAAEDLYAIPVKSVPGCGFVLGTLLKNEKIERASDLYEIFKKKKTSGFTKYLKCVVGAWNVIYVSTVVRAFEDWEKAHVVKEEKQPKQEVEKKPKTPHKVGIGSKKWSAFLMCSDLSKTSIRRVPGVAALLGCELEKRGFVTAQNLMDQYKGTKKGQCNEDEAAFHKWVLCCFGYWNSLYSKTVLEALKAYDTGHDSPNPLIMPKTEPVESTEPVELTEPTETNENQGDETLAEKITRVAEHVAESVSDALDAAKQEEETDDAKQEEETDDAKQEEETEVAPPE